MKLTTEYREEFAQHAFDKLSKIPLRDENILCLVFKCSKETLGIWKAEHPEFKHAVDLGMMSGEYKFRELMFTLALMPAGKINTKLLATLASNVYGINEEQVQKIQSAFGDNQESLEDKLKSMGIPIPNLSVEDLPEDI